MSDTEYDYNEIPAGYYDALFRRQRGAQSKWHHLKFDWLRARLPSYQHHLDIGCGAGTFIGTLDPDRESLGIDIAERQIDYARRHYAAARHRFQQVAPGRLPFSNDTFDLITLIEVIEHLDVASGRELLDEALRCLRPGGKLLITTPNYRSAWPLLEHLVNLMTPLSYQEQHITRFDADRLQQLLKEIGFADPHIERFQGIGFALAALNWTWPDRLIRWDGRILPWLTGLLLFASATKR